jgi:ligand-binding sensor domain-containing protein/signal transduction histidine kinase
LPVLKKHLLHLCFLLFWSGSAFCQPYYFRHYQVENSLSNNAVICCLQDKKGFLWLGTKDGLNRFDGYSFKIFNNDPDDSNSIGNNFIHSLYEDANGVLWIGTEKGLYKYNATTESFTILKNTANIPVRDIRMDNKGNLWFILGFTLVKYNEKTRAQTNYAVSKYFEATSICTSPDGTLWASTSLGYLKKYNGARDSFDSYDLFAHSKIPVSRWVERVYATNNETIWVGTSNQGAKSFNVSTSQYKDILTYNPDKTEIFVRNFVQTSADEIWIATESGIFIYNIKTGRTDNLQKTYNDPYSISDNAVYAFCKDREGGIWAGTYFGGVNYYPRQHTPFRKFFPQVGQNSLSGNVVREIHEDPEGNLWIGTEDAGLNKYVPTTGKFISFHPTGAKGSISYTNIHGMLIDGNELWIGTFEHGLDVMNTQTGQVVQHYSMGNDEHSLKSNFIYCISRIGKDSITLGTTRGAYLFNRAENNFSLIKGMPLNMWYTSLLKDDKGIIWAGTFGNGLNYVDTKTGKAGNFRYIASDKNSFGSDRVNSIFEDSQKNLWFATEGGLCRFNRAAQNFKTYTTKNGFPSNFILSLLEDEKKNLWISTTRGLVCFNPANENIIVYTVANGTLNDQFNYNSASKDASGRMYFGSVKGMISFHPADFTANMFVPPVYMTGFQIFDKEIAIAQKGSPLGRSIIYTDKITLSYDQSTFNIGFAALSYAAPEMSEYSYKMDGLDKEWTYLKKNRKAYFTDLSPGTYVFRVKASNSSGLWTPQEAKLIIEILPPWWASGWAYFSYAVLALLFIYYIVHNYHKRIEEKNRRKFELLEIAKEKEIFQAKVDFFTNVAHEIKTPLTLIKAPLEKVMKKAEGIPEIKSNLTIMERNTNRLVDLTNQLLDFRQTEIKNFSLSFVRVNISELLEDIYLNFKPLAEQKNLYFKLTLPREALHASIDLDAFNKIMNNLFSNLIKYAEQKALVSLTTLDVTANYFTIEFRNDGLLIPMEMGEKIFEPFFRLKQTEKQKGTGIGLALARSLTQLHKGTLILKEPEHGCNIFVLSLPIHQENEFTLTANKPEAVNGSQNTINEAYDITG